MISQLITEANAYCILSTHPLWKRTNHRVTHCNAFDTPSPLVQVIPGHQSTATLPA